MSSPSRLSFLVLPALLAMGLAACGTTTRYTATNPPPRPMASRSPDTVHIYTSSAPSTPFVEVGIIQSRQSSEFSGDRMPEIIASMRSEAARIGCDGVIINGSADKIQGSRSETHHNDSDGSSSSTHSASTQTLEGFWGACIMYTGAVVD